MKYATQKVARLTASGHRHAHTQISTAPLLTKGLGAKSQRSLRLVLPYTTRSYCRLVGRLTT